MSVPTESPAATRSAVVIRATDVLPLVPVMWMTGYWSSGEPSSSISGRSRSTAGRAPADAAARGHADAGLEVDVASSQARA